MFPKLPDLIEHRQVLSPLDLERLIGLTGGHALHGDMSPDQLLFMRPVRGLRGLPDAGPGLYLCGAGTHPGGGVTGANGRNAAREVLRDAHGLAYAARPVGQAGERISRGARGKNALPPRSCLRTSSFAKIQASLGQRLEPLDLEERLRPRAVVVLVLVAIVVGLDPVRGVVEPRGPCSSTQVGGTVGRSRLVRAVRHAGGAWRAR